MASDKNQETSARRATTPVRIAPAAQGPMQPLRPGSIRPQGWLGRYLRVIADGWTLHYARKREPWLFSVLWNRFRTPYPRPTEDQEAPDYCAYFTDGFLRLARMLPESELAAIFQEWLERVIASQDADGYLGALDPPARWNNWLELFHQVLLVEALIYNYEFTGEPRYLEVARRAAAQPLKMWGQCGDMEATLYGGHGACVIRPMLRMHALSGEKEYLELATRVMEKYGKAEHYLRGGDVGMHSSIAIDSSSASLPLRAR